MKVIFKPKEGNKDYWEIWVNEEKWREVHRSIFGKKPVFPPLSDSDSLSSVFDAFEYRRVKSYVLWRLSAQSYHSEQLKKLLKDRLVQQSTIERVLSSYREMGFLNDESWLQSFMGHQQKRYSLRFILAKLQAKGLSTETLQRIAQEWKNPEEEISAIQHLLKTRYRSKNLLEYQSKQKVIASLMRKGYAFDQIKYALEQKLSEDVSHF